MNHLHDPHMPESPAIPTEPRVLCTICHQPLKRVGATLVDPTGGDICMNDDGVDGPHMPEPQTLDEVIASDHQGLLDPPGHVETHRLVGWGTDAEFIKGYVLPRVFGHLVRLAAPVVQEFHSDLYSDAEWLPLNVTGPCEMDFVVRQHGTHLGMVGENWNMARSYMESPSMWTGGDRFYRLALTVDDRGEWSLTITRVQPEVKR